MIKSDGESRVLNDLHNKMKECWTARVLADMLKAPAPTHCVGFTNAPWLLTRREDCCLLPKQADEFEIETSQFCWIFSSFSLRIREKLILVIGVTLVGWHPGVSVASG